jgi:hypothetical protein
MTDIKPRANFEIRTTPGINESPVSFDCEIRPTLDMRIMRISQSDTAALRFSARQ